MIRRLLGLRGRLLLGLVLTSVVTLAVAAYALVGPLTERLRRQNIETLRDAALQARPDFERALARPDAGARARRCSARASSSRAAPTPG